MDDVPEVASVHVGLPEEEGKDWDKGGGRCGKDIGTHGEGAAEIGCSEAHGVKEGDCGFDGGNRCGDDWRV